MNRFRGIALLCLPLAIAACRKETEERTADTRTPVRLPPEAAEAVRVEMRGLVAALQGVLAAAPARDTAAMLTAARAGGTPAAADTALEQLLPEGWMTPAMQMHAGFDSLAVAIRGGARTDSVAARLGRILPSCVNCHAQYRIAVTDD